MCVSVVLVEGQLTHTPGGTREEEFGAYHSRNVGTEQGVARRHRFMLDAMQLVAACSLGQERGCKGGFRLESMLCLIDGTTTLHVTRHHGKCFNRFLIVNDRHKQEASSCNDTVVATRCIRASDTSNHNTRWTVTGLRVACQHHQP